MGVKVKSKDGFNDEAKIKCSAIEFLILRKALTNFINDVNEDIDDRRRAEGMYDAMKGEYK